MNYLLSYPDDFRLSFPNTDRYTMRTRMFGVNESPFTYDILYPYYDRRIYRPLDRDVHQNKCLYSVVMYNNIQYMLRFTAILIRLSIYYTTIYRRQDKSTTYCYDIRIIITVT